MMSSLSNAAVPTNEATPADVASSDAAVSPAMARPETAESLARDGGVTWRVILLALLLAGCFGYLIPIIDLQVRNTYLGAGPLPPGALAVLLALLLIVNPLLRLLSSPRRRFALSRNEILTVYITCLFSTLVPGMGSESLFVSHLIGSFYYATRENRWLQFLQPYLKPWFTPALDAHGQYGDWQRKIVEGWYTGTGAAAVPWGAWLVPLVVWSAFVMASYIMLGCLSVMLRAQWGEHEALAFPLLRLPLELTENQTQNGEINSANTSSFRLHPASFLSSPVMWLGFGAAVFIEGINGLNVYFPDVPHLPLAIGTGGLFSEAPWNQMAPFGIYVWPIFVGITYLLTAEVSFSLWFFLWFIQAQYIVAYYLGFPYGTLPGAIGHSSDGGGKTFTALQQVGAYLAYAAIMLWTARAHLQHIALRAFGRARAGAGEAAEALSYPVAFWGFIGAFAFMIGWSCAAGMRVDVALALWGLYIVTCIVLTRAVVEGGVMFINQGWVPLGTLAQLVGSGPGQWLAPSSIVPATFFQVSFFTDMRAFLMPSFLQGFKLAHDQGIASRRLWPLVLVSTAVAMSVGIWMKVQMGYHASGLTLHAWFSTVAPRYPAQNSQQFIQGVATADWSNWCWLVLGGLFTYLMILARSRLLWFPLHPIGYMLALTAPTQRAWFSFFLGWLSKTLITRFGGHEAYRKLRPAFLGLILGEVSMFLLWLLVDAWQGRSGHGLLP